MQAGPNPEAAVADPLQEAGRLLTDHRPADALALLDRLLAAAPDDPVLLSNHALVLSHLGRLAQAEAQLRRALAQSPGFVSAWVNLARVLHLQGDHAGAERAAQQAAALAPDEPAALTSQAQALLAGARPVAALALFRRSLARDASRVDTWIGLGEALLAAGDSVAACDALGEACRRDPQHQAAASNLLLALQGQPGLTLQDLRASAMHLGGRWRMVQQPEPRWPPRAARPLRIGYLGGDFRAHPVGWMLLPVLQQHDRDRVEVHLFDTRAEAAAVPLDDRALALRAAASRVHAIGGLDDDAATRCVRDAGIDVLVDLAGHTAGGRPGVFARRAAPLQVAWLGFLASTGVPGIDAVVVGADAADDAAGLAHAEPLLPLDRLALAYAPPADLPPLPDGPPASRPLRFGCFNNPAKFSDPLLSTWSRLMAGCPGATLVLKWAHFAEEASRDRLLQRLAAHGIDRARVELRPASPHAQMLAEYADIDIALDPFPFTGGISTLEALAMGVPVVTLAGLRPLARQSVGVLQSVGLGDAVATDAQGYCNAVWRLAADAPRRHLLRTTLRDRLLQGPVGDGAGLARALERAFGQALDRRLDHTPAPSVATSEPAAPLAASPAAADQAAWHAGAA